jgi:uncharacterized protein (DUF1697 family)
VVVRVVGLLRGVNLGGRRLSMADLRAAVEGLGHRDVETYLQSGNVVFTPHGRGDLGAGITKALKEAVGLDVPVLTRTGAEMRKVVGANPYDREDPTKVVVVFLESAGDATPIKGLDLPSFEPEGLTVKGTHIYLDLPGGQARSKLLDAMGKQKVFGTASTSRTWRTVQAIAEMAAR